MSEQSWLRRRWKLVVNVITLLALAILIFATRHQIASTFSNLGHVHAWFLLLAIPLEAINYHAQTKIYQRLFEIVGNKLDYKFLYRASLELNFVNHVFPSGGVTGLSYFSLRMRKGKELTAAKATLIHIMKIVLYVAAFEIILIFGVIALAVMGKVNRLVILIAGSISTLLIVGSFAFVYVLGSRKRIDSFLTAMTKLVNRIIRLVKPSYHEAINVEKARGVFLDLHNNFDVLKKNRRALKSPFWYSFLADVTEVAALYNVYIAFGKFVNIGAVILAYGIANFAGLISIMPAGVGIYEALMTAVLAGAGVSPGTSLPITVMYRVVNTSVQVPIGAVFYQRTLRRTKLAKA